MNCIYVIFPYKFSGIWMFDDEAHDLKKEAFVSGMPEIINNLVKKLKNPENGFSLYFSQAEFPGFQLKLEHLKEEFSGNWYLDKKTGNQGWLCPALFCYFDKAPRFLYARAEEKKLIQ